ncbi:HpcH/HpaI aldolase/citrate lyase family protein [Lachnobacterium bovis]|uniref:HpcH/HpaI aldolase/citrate lyase family protein n=1 Tax=Lachnobacterium bovis TaxID=140626 RepID=UPI00068A554D|nr:HpcH/HpaI aldolase/citrate lyase family protein [Lachnobacterium bovis]
MKNSELYYSVGALLYSPANKSNIARKLINEDFGHKFSLALCLEDTINDNFVSEAETIMIKSLNDIYDASKKNNFYIPKIFIRVRNPKQISDLTKRLGESRTLVKGFIIPKFSLENAQNYISEIKKINSDYEQTFYVLPILEDSTLTNELERVKILYKLKDLLNSIEKYVLNIRVGGNDLCNNYGFRRHSDETIYDIVPIANILANIVTIFGTDYVISGPVWEYFDGYNWEEGLKNELRRDLNFGFIGKTVIHPKQISAVNNALKVSHQDYLDACSILNYDLKSSQLVSKKGSQTRMNEYKTHYRWAQKIWFLAKEYGVTSSFDITPPSTSKHTIK